MPETQLYGIRIWVADYLVAACDKTLPNGIGGDLLKAVQDAANKIQLEAGIPPDVGSDSDD